MQFVTNGPDIPDDPGRTSARRCAAGAMFQPRVGSAFARLRAGWLTVPAALSRNGLKIPSIAEELAALTRSSAARRRGSRSQGLIYSNEPFMDRLGVKMNPVVRIDACGAMP